MNSKQVRRKFLEFFENKKHKIVPSAPLVNKTDPTLMFVNAGMNQFKDYFLGHSIPEFKRIADTQKCLRVSGKHNDLEDVGIDSYHHTLFEMLGNWSFGDYFKKEAIEWAWELLTEIYEIDKDRIYVTVFGGDLKDNLSHDSEAAEYWMRFVNNNRILKFGKKDNFWEMGESGPCGPCSEIHVDLRSDEDRKKIDGSTLVNQDNPEVIEIWNLVFIQYNRDAEGKLHLLPEKHVDTGMGFERLCMVLQNKKSNYETDVFSDLIEYIEKSVHIKYTNNYDRSSKSDVAIRVLADHIRAVAFCIADGEMPSNTGAGYVVRRILRRAVRYYYSFLGRHEPLLYLLIDILANYFSDIFPELKLQADFVKNVILEEEKSFLATLEHGLKKIDHLQLKDNTIVGKDAFELYDTFGFPIDLTVLIASEKGISVDISGFEAALKEQKERSKKDAKTDRGDWILINDDKDITFYGYDQLELIGSKILKYRSITRKDKTIYQIVLNNTPFYAEGGGQVGDTGYIVIDGEKIKVTNTEKENDLILHIVENLPKNIKGEVQTIVDKDRRKLIENNHSTTHLLQAALRQVLGTHVQQRGSLVNEKYLRFDFSHFKKMTEEEIMEVEKIVNAKIRENIERIENRELDIELAKEAGAMMIFGEKYDKLVRMISFDKDYSIELCGGCHVPRTGQIGLFKIISESAIAAGVRRIEGVTSIEAENFINNELAKLNEIKNLYKNPGNVLKTIEDQLNEIKVLRKELETLKTENASSVKDVIIKEIKEIKDVKILSKLLEMEDSKLIKTLAFNLVDEFSNLIVLFGFLSNDKPQLMLAIGKEALSKNYNASIMVKELAKNINGGGGGQNFFATAGGSKKEGLLEALNKLHELI